MIVHDVPDLQRNTGSLGSVVFSESFLESSINIQHRGSVWIRLDRILLEWIESGMKIRFR